MAGKTAGDECAGGGRDGVAGFPVGFGDVTTGGGGHAAAGVECGGVVAGRMPTVAGGGASKMPAIFPVVIGDGHATDGRTTTAGPCKRLRLTRWVNIQQPTPKADRQDACATLGEPAEAGTSLRSDASARQAPNIELR
jgi:hypothetical protein